MVKEAVRDGQAREIWNAVLGELELQVTRPIFETWLKGTSGLAFNENFLIVGVSTPFAAEWLEKRMYQLIQKSVQKVAKAPLEVRFQVGAQTQRGEDRELEGGEELDLSPTSYPPSPNGSRSQANPCILNKKYTFQSFVVGPSNRLAYSAALAVAEAPGHSYNPLFVYSGVGLGKTHLLHAIAHAIAPRNLSFLYVTSEQFTNEFIRAIRDRSTEDFRSKYRSVDVLLIDDIHFIAGKEQTQEGFFHTFNALHNSGRQIVMTSDRPPKALSLLEDRLRSRFEWGLIADIQPPDLETRMAILRIKAEELSIELDDSVVEFVAKKVQKNVRELEGTLNRIVAFAQLTGVPITIDLSGRALADIIADPSRRSIDHHRVLKEVSKRFKISYDDLMGPKRTKEVVLPRQVAMYLLREELAMSLTEIGRLLGGKSHPTVMHAVGKINYDMNADPHLRQDILAIKEALFATERN